MEKATRPILFFVVLSFFTATFVFGQDAQKDSLPNLHYPDSLSIVDWIASIRSVSRKDRLNFNNFLPQIDSAIALSVHIKDTSSHITALYIKSLWLRDKDLDSLAWSVDSARIKLLFHRGFILLDTLRNSEESLYRYNVIEMALRIFIDSTDSIPFDTIVDPGFQSNFIPNYDNRRDIDTSFAYWAKIRIRGNGKSKEEILLLPSWEDAYWQYVQFYRPGIGDEWLMDEGGATIPIFQRVTNNFRDLYKLEVPANADFYVYFRLQGTKNYNWPRRVTFRQLPSSFLQENQKSVSRVYTFIGILTFQLFFFLLWSIATRERTFIPYLFYILSLIAVALTSVDFRYWFPNPEFDRVNLYFVMQIFFAWLAGLSFLQFTKRFLNMSTLAPRWNKVLNIFMVLFTVVAQSLVLPVSYLFFAVPDFESTLWVLFAENYNFIASIFIFLFAVGLVFVAISGGLAWKNKSQAAKYYLVAICLLLLGICYLVWIMVFEGSLFDSMGMDMNVVQAGIILQLCFFALGMGSKRRILEKEKLEAQENLIKEQSKVNSAFGRFVPHKFLEAIGRDSVLDIQLGDGVEKEVTVFFSDIRGYTQMAETMAPKENFGFLNGYLGRMGPIISDHQGFVNQYYGDGIMAIFMQEPKYALDASISIHSALQQYNSTRIEKGRMPIHIGIGLHTGPLIMGVIGDTLRMEAGVVSDTVNTAARMEGLTKHFGASILVSETVFGNIGDTAPYQYRFLGKVQVKGRKEPLKVYDFFDGDHKEIQKLKRESGEDFSEALEAYTLRDFQRAMQKFKAVLKIFPEDLSSQYYLGQAQKLFLMDLDETWSGIVEMKSK